MGCPVSNSEKSSDKAVDEAMNAKMVTCNSSGAGRVAEGHSIQLVESEEEEDAMAEEDDESLDLPGPEIVEIKLKAVDDFDDENEKEDADSRIRLATLKTKLEQQLEKMTALKERAKRGQEELRLLKSAGVPGSMPELQKDRFIDAEIVEGMHRRGESTANTNRPDELMRLRSCLPENRNVLSSALHSPKTPITRHSRNASLNTKPSTMIVSRAASAEIHVRAPRKPATARHGFIDALEHSIWVHQTKALLQTAELDRLRKELDTTRQQLGSTRQELEQADREVLTTRDELEAAKVAIDDLQKNQRRPHSGAGQAELASLRARNEGLRSELARTKQQLDLASRPKTATLALLESLEKTQRKGLLSGVESPTTRNKRLVVPLDLILI